MYAPVLDYRTVECSPPGHLERLTGKAHWKGSLEMPGSAFTPACCGYSSVMTDIWLTEYDIGMRSHSQARSSSLSSHQPTVIYCVSAECVHFQHLTGRQPTWYHARCSESRHFRWWHQGFRHHVLDYYHHLRIANVGMLRWRASIVLQNATSAVCTGHSAAG